MRKFPLTVLIVLTTVALAATAWAANTVTYTPRPGAEGALFAVYDFEREGGRAQPSRVIIDWGTIHRSFIAIPYGRCESVTPAGFIIKLKQAGQGTLRITTSSGLLLRAPYQGDPPLELTHACYRVQK